MSRYPKYEPTRDGRNVFDWIVRAVKSMRETQMPRPHAFGLDKVPHEIRDFLTQRYK